MDKNDSFNEQRQSAASFEEYIMTLEKRSDGTTGCCLPAAVQKLLGEEITLFPGPEHTIRLYSKESWRVFLDGLLQRTYREVKQLRPLFEVTSAVTVALDGFVPIAERLLSYGTFTNQVLIRVEADRGTVTLAARRF